MTKPGVFLLAVKYKQLLRRSLHVQHIFAVTVKRSPNISSGTRDNGCTPKAHLGICENFRVLSVYTVLSIVSFSFINVMHSLAVPLSACLLIQRRVLLFFLLLLDLIFLEFCTIYLEVLGN